MRGLKRVICDGVVLAVNNIVVGKCSEWVIVGAVVFMVCCYEHEVSFNDFKLQVSWFVIGEGEFVEAV